MKIASDIELFDANAWIGGWPFVLRPVESAAMLARRIKSASISAALVSPLGAVLAPDPMPANRELLETTKRRRTLHPVPVINLRLRIWPQHLDEVCEDSRVRAIRLLPTFHGYSMHSAVVSEFMRELERRNLRPIVTARLEDERQKYFALSVRGIPIRSLRAYLERFGKTRVLCTGLYRPEILELASSGNLLADTSMAEWDQTVRGLLAKIPVRRLCFGSLSPFLSITGNVAKVIEARVPKASRQQIGSRNLSRFLGQ